MGNDLFKGKNAKKACEYGQICIQTEKVSYFAGETIQGNIYLNLIQPYDGDKLILKFKGREYVHWVDHVQINEPNENRRRHRDVHRKQKEKVHDTHANLYDWKKNKIFPGQFCFPFSLVLPPKLAGTYFSKRQRILGDISYHLEAVLKPNKDSQPKLKYKHNIIINEPPTRIAETQNIARETNLYSCCCFQKGSAALYASFQKNVYIPGEIATVLIDLDNRQSQVDCSRIVFSLKQKLTMRTNSHQMYREFVIISRDDVGVLSGRQSEKKIISLNLPPAEEQSLWVLKSQGNIEELLIQSTGFSETINPTTHGKLITSEFFLDVQAQMDGCCITTPQISIPIDIHAPIYQQAPIAPPPDWQPQIMEVSNVSYGGYEAVNLNPNLNQNIGYNMEPGYGNMNQGNYYPEQAQYQQNMGMNMA